jgi:hypothetical protein
MSAAYCFCELHKPDAQGTLRRICWIPADHAAVGKVVRIKDADTGEWSDGWRVASTSEPRPARQVEDYARQSHRAGRLMQ